MKSIYILLLCCVMTQAYAQPYQPLAKNNARWLETVYSMMGPQFDQSFCYFSKDTQTYFFAGHPYRNYELIYDSVYNLSKKSKSVYLYDDTLNRKIYRYTTSEYLYYDFSKNVGDTIQNILCSMTGSLTSLIVDSIDQQILFGINRKLFYLRDTNHLFPYTVWVEGIGSIIGLEKNSFFCLPTDPVYGLNCVHENGNQLIGTGCSFKVVGLNDPNQPSSIIHLASNPILNHQVQLKNPTQIAFTWQLISVDGKTLKRGTETNINMNEYSNGIYYLKIETENKTNFTLKILNN